MNLNWEHLKEILEVARRGSVRQAAFELGIAHTTLNKRISAAENSLGAVIFIRNTRGVTLTKIGQSILLNAQRMENEANEAISIVSRYDKASKGDVSISIMAPVLTHIIAAHLDLFYQENPEFHLNFDTTYTFADLHKHDVDIVVRFQNEPSPFLVGRRVVTQFDAIYIAKTTKSFDVTPCQMVKFIGWGKAESMRNRLLAHGVENAEIICDASDIDSQVSMVATGLGAGVLPCFVGDKDARLKRYKPSTPKPMNDAWVLTNPDLINSVRVKTVMDFLVRALRSERSSFEGRNRE